MTRATTHLGGTASNVVVGKVAHGLMKMTWTSNVVPDQQCFEAIKAGIDALPPGAKMFLNGGTFYGHNLSTTNLEMLARFFEKYPEYVDRTFLSIKGGIASGELRADCSPENLTRNVDLANEKLRGTKRLDLFQCARVDSHVSVEVSIAALAKLKREGKLDHIGMSACSAEVLRRGHRVHPISVVEIEVSPFSYNSQTREVISTAKELGVAVAGYSPLGSGFLAAQTKREQRGPMPRVPDDDLLRNLATVDALTKLANKKNHTPAQVAIAWVSSLGSHVIPLPGSSYAKRTLENCAGGDVVLTQAELREINRVIEGVDVLETRHASPYPASGHTTGELHVRRDNLGCLSS